MVNFSFNGLIISSAETNEKEKKYFVIQLTNVLLDIKTRVVFEETSSFVTPPVASM